LIDNLYKNKKISKDLNKTKFVWPVSYISTLSCIMSSLLIGNVFVQSHASYCSILTKQLYCIYVLFDIFYEHNILISQKNHDFTSLSNYYWQLFNTLKTYIALPWIIITLTCWLNRYPISSFKLYLCYVWRILKILKCIKIIEETYV